MSKRISKKMSFILRHDPDSVNFKGFISLASIAEMLDCPVSVVEQICDTDDKGRYEIAGEAIRAVQGHSFPVDLGLASISPPNTLFHGTVREAADLISVGGITSRSRQFVHLSENLETATTVGSRRGTPVILEVDAKRMFDSGLEFFQAANGVWLTGSVPASFVSEKQ